MKNTRKSFSPFIQKKFFFWKVYFQFLSKLPFPFHIEMPTRKRERESGGELNREKYKERRHKNLEIQKRVKERVER